MAIDVALIRESFALARPIGLQIVERFYENLWQDYPDAKPMFAKVNMPRQKAALLNSLVTAVDHLENPTELGHFLQGLGERHIKYGVEDIHYDWVGASLLKTFSQFFGTAWTDPLQQQWAEFYGLMAEAMKQAARAARSKTIMPEATAIPPGAAAARSAATDSLPKVRPVRSESNSDNRRQGTEASLWSLPEETKHQIRVMVRAAVGELLREEIRRCFREEVQNALTGEMKDFLKKAV